MKTRMLGGSVSITVASITGSRRSFVTPAQKSSAYNFLGNVVASTPREKKVCRSHGAFHAHCRRNTRAPALFSSSTCEPTTLLVRLVRAATNYGVILCDSKSQESTFGRKSCLNKTAWATSVIFKRWGAYPVSFWLFYQRKVTAAGIHS